MESLSSGSTDNISSSAAFALGEASDFIHGFAGMAGVGSMALVGGGTSGSLGALLADDAAALWGGASRALGAVADLAPGLLGTAAGMLGGVFLPSSLGANDGNPGPDAQAFQGGAVQGASSSGGLLPGPRFERKRELPMQEADRHDWLWGMPAALQKPVNVGFPADEAGAWRQAGSEFPAAGVSRPSDSIYVSRAQGIEAGLINKELSRQAIKAYKDGTPAPAQAQNTVGLNMTVAESLIRDARGRPVATTRESYSFEPRIDRGVDDVYLPKHLFVLDAHASHKDVKLEVALRTPSQLQSISDEAFWLLKEQAVSGGGNSTEWVIDRTDGFPLKSMEVGLAGKQLANWLVSQRELDLQTGVAICLHGCNSGRMTADENLGEPEALDPENMSYLIPSFAHQVGLLTGVVPDVLGFESELFSPLYALTKNGLSAPAKPARSKGCKSLTTKK